MLQTLNYLLERSEDHSGSMEELVCCMGCTYVNKESVPWKMLWLGWNYSSVCWSSKERYRQLQGYINAFIFNYFLLLFFFFLLSSLNPSVSDLYLVKWPWFRFWFLSLKPDVMEPRVCLQNGHNLTELINWSITQNFFF